MDRGQYSFKGSYPQKLPDYWKFEDGSIRTDLQEISDEELFNLGWVGPIDMPPFPNTTYFTHSYEWNEESLSFNSIELDQYDLMRRVDYQTFWDLLLNGVPVEGSAGTQTSGAVAYKKIKGIAAQSLIANTLVTEFISLISDAKFGRANVKKIQECLDDILEIVTFTVEEKEEIEKIFMNSGMFAIYTLNPTVE